MPTSTDCKHYKDLQILEMILSVSGNNSINRWKEGRRATVERGRQLPARVEGRGGGIDVQELLTPTPAEYKEAV
jgi:hypothetical protein